MSDPDSQQPPTPTVGPGATQPQVGESVTVDPVDAAVAPSVEAPAAAAAAEAPAAEAADRRTPVSIKGFLSDTVLYGLVDVSDKAIGFAVLPITTLLLSTADYGTLSLYGTTATIAFMVVSLCMNNAFFRFYTEYHDDARRRQALDTAFWVMAVWAVLLAAVALPLAGRANAVLFGPDVVVRLSEQPWIGWLARWLPIDGVTLFTLVLAVSAGRVLVALADSRLQADGRARTYVRIHLFALLFIRGLALLLLVYGGGLMGWILGEALGVLVLTVLACWVGLRGLGTRVTRPMLRELLPYGISVLPVGLSHWVMTGADRFVIDYLLPDGRDQVGLYSVGERVASIMFLVNYAFALGWRRFAFSNMHLADGPARLAGGVTLYYALAAYGALGLCLLGDDLAYWVIDEKFLPGMVVIVPLTLAAFFWGLGEICSIGLHKTKKTGWLGSLNTVAAVANVAINFWLIPRFGILGAASATLACQVGKFLILGVRGQQVFPIPWQWGRLTAVSGIFLLAYFAARLLDLFGPLTEAVGQSAVLAAVPVVLWSSPFLTADDRRQAVALVGRLGGVVRQAAGRAAGRFGRRR